jgi:hypothetical protein
MRDIRFGLAALVALWVASSFSCPQAQQTGTIFAHLRIPRLAQLTIGGDISGMLTLAQDGSGEIAFENGSAESAADATTLTIDGNAPWDLSAKLAGNWTCPGAYDKAETDLKIRITNTPTGTIQNGADSYISLLGADTEILSHDDAVAENDIDIQTQVLLDWTTDIPGAYSITVTYTLVVHVP